MVETNSSNAASYGAKDIQVLEGLEAVRRRPGMYVGGTDLKALHHLVYEVVDNSIDEALAGVCDRIDVTIHADSSVTVRDNGRGIPVDIHPDKKKSALEVVMTVLHAGGKFGGSSYKVSGGLHGVGVSAVNALSEWCEVKVYRDGNIYFQRYERGIPVSQVKEIGKTDSKNTGTETTFLFDREIFKGEIDFKFETLIQRFREMAFVTRNVKIILQDERPLKKRSPSYSKAALFHSYVTWTATVKHCTRYSMPKKRSIISALKWLFNILTPFQNLFIRLPTPSTLLTVEPTSPVCARQSPA